MPDRPTVDASSLHRRGLIDLDKQAQAVALNEIRSRLEMPRKDHLCWVTFQIRIKTINQTIGEHHPTSRIPTKLIIILSGRRADTRHVALRCKRPDHRPIRRSEHHEHDQQAS